VSLKPVLAASLSASGVKEGAAEAICTKQTVYATSNRKEHRNRENRVILILSKTDETRMKDGIL
jgi:hypothetical protein